MTFPEYFQECQTLITKEIDLPFDCPFPQPWIDENTETFSNLQYCATTPEKAVKMHFERIERVALLMAKMKVKKINQKYENSN